jgi:hypothetical protein
MSNEMQPPAGERPSEAGKRSLVQRALDAIFGYDFFISYTRRDGGKEYAEALARRLRGAGFQIFFDSDEYAMGDDWIGCGIATIPEWRTPIQRKSFVCRLFLGETTYQVMTKRIHGFDSSPRLKLLIVKLLRRKDWPEVRES